MKRLTCLPLLVLAVWCTNVKADVLFNQAADTDITHNGSMTSYDPLPIVADDFTPNADWLVTGATFFGQWRTDSDANPTGSTRTFRFDFYADAGGQPSDTPIASLTTDATLSNMTNVDVFSEYNLAVDFPSVVSLSSGVTYWFSVVDEGLGRNGADGFNWIISPNGNYRVAQKSDSGWIVYSDTQDYAPDDVTFSLIGTSVPEPSSLLLSIIAVTAICLRNTGKNLANNRNGPRFSLV